MSNHSDEVDASYRAWLERGYQEIKQNENPLLQVGIRLVHLVLGRRKGGKPVYGEGIIYNGNTYVIEASDTLRAAKNRLARKPDLLATDVLGENATEEDLIAAARENYANGMKPSRSPRGGRQRRK